MATRLFTNNATTTLASGITSTATALTVATGAGALFPSPPANSGQYFIATIVKAGNSAVYEVIKCTARTTDTFTTIVRAQEGTTAQAWNSGDTVALLVTAGDLGGFVQFDDLQSQSGNYAADTGAANAYAVTLSPALSAHVTGLPIRWLAAHSNTGASTFNDGAGSASLVYPGGSALVSGEIVAGYVYTSIFNGSVFELFGASSALAQSYASTAQSNAETYAASQASTAQSNAEAYTNTKVANLAPLASPTFTGTPAGPTAAVNSSSTQLATTAFVNPNNLRSVDGYRENPDGTYDQWMAVTASGTAGQVVAWPISFPTAVWNVQTTTSVSGYSAAVTAANVNNFTLDTSKLYSGMTVWVRAIGY